MSVNVVGMRVTGLNGVIVTIKNSSVFDKPFVSEASTQILYGEPAAMSFSLFYAIVKVLVTASKVRKLGRVDYPSS